jgi:hypothetical protein
VIRMKKIFLIAFCFALAGCTPVDRKNPTDPQASNYIGWHYLGEIGEFTALSDFAVVLSVPIDDSSTVQKPYIMCVDRAAGTLSQYLLEDGTYIGYIANYPLPAPQTFINPSGICALNGFIYITDQDPSNSIGIDAFDTTTYNNFWGASGASVAPGYKIAGLGSTLYIAVSKTAAVSMYTPDTVNKTYSAAVPWTMVTNPATDGYISCISDISAPDVSPLNTIMIVDSDINRISFFTPSGGFLSKIDMNTPIIGAACYNNTIYVPSTAGIIKVSYVSGNVIGTIANYGEGNGRIGGPAQIRLSPSNNGILVNNGTSIKYFETSGL